MSPGLDLLIVPMIKEDTLVGTIAIYRQEIRPFTDKQIELVRKFAAQAVIAIENTRLSAQRTARIVAAADRDRRCLKVISSSPGDLQPVFNAILENAVRICDAKFGSSLLREGDFCASVLHGAPAHLPPIFGRRRSVQNRRRHWPTRSRTKQLFHIADITALPTYVQAPRGPRSNWRRANFDRVPMLKDNEVIGAIAIYRQEVRPFTDKQIELVKNFAAQAVIAIENTRLLNELRESSAAADRDRRRAQGHQSVRLASSSRCSRPCWRMRCEICEASYGNMWLREGETFARRRFTALPPALLKNGGAARVPSSA